LQGNGEDIMDKTSNQTTPVSGSVERLLDLGPRPLIPGEDPAAYDAHLDRVADALKPVDYIGDMMVRDVADIDWEVLRRRGQYSQHLTDKIYVKLPAVVQSLLAPRCTSTSSRSVLEILAESYDPSPPSYEALMAHRLVRECRRGNAKALRRVDNLLARSGRSLKSFAADALAENIDVFARFDHMIATLELRRTAMLREFDRHQAVVGDQRARVAQIADQTSRPAE
jgi:hypothetical protein